MSTRADVEYRGFVSRMSSDGYLRVVLPSLVRGLVECKSDREFLGYLLELFGNACVGTDFGYDADYCYRLSVEGNVARIKIQRQVAFDKEELGELADLVKELEKEVSRKLQIRTDEKEAILEVPIMWS